MDSSYLEDPQAVFSELCRRDFTVFLRKAWPWVSGGESLAWNWHLDAIAYRLEQIASGESRRLLINLPPRNAKSKTISVIWVAWQLGRDPSLNFVCVSYSNELSGKLARDCLSIMQSHWYRELFPRAIISQKRSAAYDFETTAGGGRLATSVTGTLTGRGGDIIILDDVIKPEEANSETTRNSVNEWFQSTLASRLNDKTSGSILCVMQRLHQFDLSGMLLDAGGWTHLSLPAIAVEESTVPLPRGRSHARQVGDVLHPAREPLAVLDELKAAMGSYAFQAQYQQDPVPADGNVIKAEWLQTWSESSVGDAPGEIVQSWDTANKAGANNDWSVCLTARVWRNRVYVINVFRARLEFSQLKKASIDLARKYNARVLLIEDQASGQQLIQTLRAEQPRGVPAPISRRPETDKYSRVAGISSMVEAGQLLLPEEAAWLSEFKSELLGFPNARFDDQVDALSQLMTWVRTRQSQSGGAIGSPLLIWTDEFGQIQEVGGDVYNDEAPEDYENDGVGEFLDDDGTDGLF